MLGLALAGPAAAQEQAAATRAGAEPPTFERLGFPMTPVQLQVLGSSHVRERSPAPSLMLHDMPASPHQVSVLTPRPRAIEATIAPARTKAAFWPR
jgi:hypothetical protein